MRRKFILLRDAVRIQCGRRERSSGATGVGHLACSQGVSSRPRAAPADETEGNSLHRGFQFGKEGVSALLQSMKSAESWVCQKRLSSASFLKFGFFFFMIDTFPVLASGAYAQWRTDNIVSGKKTKARCLPASGGAEGDQGLCYIYS